MWGFPLRDFFLSPFSSSRVMSLRNYSLTTNIFRNAANSETGLKLEMQDFLSFLYGGFTFEY